MNQDDQKPFDGITPEAPQVEQETSPPNEAQQQAAAGELPEKFRGKSAAEIAEMYQNLEKQAGKSGSEIGAMRERHDELMGRIRQLEASYSRPQTVSAPEEDPVQLFKKEAAENPELAIVNLVKRTTSQVEKQVHGVYNSVQEEGARDYVQSQLRDNPDFKENFDTMKELERDFGGIIRPEFARSKLAYQLLYDLARGRNLSRYESKAIEKARTSGSQIRNEKKAAFSESSSPSQGNREEKPFSQLSLDEMRKRLGYSSN